MSGIFDDLILRKKVGFNNRKSRWEREREVLQLFGDYCEKHREDLKELYQYVDITNKECAFKSDPWNFNLYVCQNKEQKANLNSYYIRVYLSKVHVSTSKTGGWHKEFPFSYAMNKVQLTRIIKNALRCLVMNSYILPKDNQ